MAKLLNYEPTTEDQASPTGGRVICIDCGGDTFNADLYDDLYLYCVRCNKWVLKYVSPSQIRSDYE